ncbi:carboxypeptidase-like regulatory domain-containing protein [Gemmatimonadota bacterium]
MAKNKSVLLGLFLILLLCPPVQAQETTGNIQGRVLDQNGNPLPAANISVMGPSLQGQSGAFSFKDGSFMVPHIPPGIYEVTISYIGYRIVIIQDVSVKLGRTTPISEVWLEEQPIEMEPVIVTGGARSLIDQTSTTTGDNFTPVDLRLLPIDRIFRSVMPMIPVPPKNSILFES